MRWGKQKKRKGEKNRQAKREGAGELLQPPRSSAFPSCRSPIRVLMLSLQTRPTKQLLLPPHLKGRDKESPTTTKKKKKREEKEEEEEEESSSRR